MKYNSQPENQLFHQLLQRGNQFFNDFIVTLSNILSYTGADMLG